MEPVTSYVFSFTRELQNNILGVLLSQYKHCSHAKESNQNYYGLLEQKLLQNYIQKNKNLATYITIYTFPAVFVVNCRDQFLINSDIHNINIRHISNLLLPLENLGIYQKGLYYSDITIFNSVSFGAEKFSSNLRTFKSALKYFT